MGVVLQVLVKKGLLGIHFLKKGILTKQGTYIMAILVTGILNNYHMGSGLQRLHEIQAAAVPEMSCNSPGATTIRLCNEVVPQSVHMFFRLHMCM